MAIVMTDAGETWWLTRVSNNVFAKCGLFTNNHTPSASDTKSSYTEVSNSDWMEYSAKDCWNSFSTLTHPADKAEIADMGVDFGAPISPPAGLIYGYFLYNGSQLIAAELFSSPRSVGAGHFTTGTITLFLDNPS